LGGTETQLQHYAKLARDAEEAFHARYRGARVTHYLHCFFYHHEEKQEGWEKMNDVDRRFIERHSTHRAAVGAKLWFN